MYRKLILTLPDDNLILTPNRRLALTLADSHHALMQKKVNKALNVSALQDYLQSLWLSLGHSHCLLSSFQEQLLWQDIISADTKDDLLLPAHRIAQQAMRSYQLVESFEINLTPDDILTHTDGETFLHWLSIFREELDKRKLITRASLPKKLMQEHLSLTLPKQITLLGFIDPAPVIKHFFDQISNRSSITWYDPKGEEADTIRAEFANPETEIKAMAAWAKQTWLNHPDPNTCHIACVVPNLTEEKNRLSRLFSDMLSDEGDLFSEKPPFNMSQGSALLDYPMIKTAFDCFKAHPNHRETLLISQLLGNPYITSYNNPEAPQAAQADTQIRRHDITTISNDTLLITLQEGLDDSSESPLFKRWNAYLSYSLPHTLLFPSEWNKHLSALLAHLDWPGQQPLRSDEFQLRERWQASLIEIASLDDLLGNISQQRYTELLYQHLSQTVFQPQAHRAPIHVLGLLEASGLSFDAVWIMGLDSNTWPAQAQPDPYLPTHIQHQYNLPQSTAQRERDFALMHQQHISLGTPSLVLSSAQRHDDIPREPSVLINHIPLATDDWLKSLAQLSPSYLKWCDPNNLLQKPESHGQAIKLNNRPLLGGSAIVNEQAKCPFRAFALFRLHATSPKTPQFGINAAAHGMLVHHALELVWQELKTQEKLLQLGASKRQEFIQQIAQRVIAQEPNLPKRLRHSHTLILETTLTQWLALECARSPFKVKETEQKETLSVGSYRIRVRLDRVDELPDGSILIIDYKTGMAPALTQCLPPHSTENQLPLYASFSRYRNKTIGFAFGVTHRDAMGWSGLIQAHQHKQLPITKVDSLKHDGNPLSWEQLNDFWKKRTLQLLDDFTQGVADILPIQANLTCRYCQCRSICRIGLSK